MTPTALTLSLLLTGLFGAPPAWANGDAIDLECPCEIDGDGTTATVTAGVRSFRSTDSEPLFVGIQGVAEGGYYYHLGRVSIADSLAAGATQAADTFEIEWYFPWQLDDEQVLNIALYEQFGDRLRQRDSVRMEAKVNVRGEFTVGDLDLLTDGDGDGVADRNETAAGTDAADAESTPPDSTLDVLVLYSQSVPGVYDGDPTTRIQHEFTTGNRILTDSGVQAQFRVVGMVEVEADESNVQSRVELDTRLREAGRHGADLVVVYRPPPFGAAICGYADIGGYRGHGLFELQLEQRAYVTVFTGCGARTLAHELGHLMGLGHSYWQQSVGTWRWSRGHAVDHDFGTVMSYGPQTGSYRRLEVFSDPQSSCTGLQEVAKACGVARAEVNGADAVASLNAVRFQIAGFRDSHPDADGDGFVDPVDDLPNVAGEWIDTDGDGIGNKADTDDDGDGVADDTDVFPLDAAESVDTDGDGVGDNSDALPLDPTETADVDGDGVGDSSDVFPLDPAETQDTDGDGVGDNGDPWPEDPKEWLDTDGDDTGNNSDTDDDNDGVADGLDIYPLDAARTDLASYLLVGEQPGDQAGRILSPGGKGEQASFILGVPQHGVGDDSFAGAVYLVSGSDLAALDAADGRTDRVIDLAHLDSGTSSWKFTGEAGGHRAGGGLASSGDMDGDGYTDLMIGAAYFTGEDGLRNRGAAYFVSGADFAAADAADGTADHTIELGRIASRPGSWKLVGEAIYNELGLAVAAVSDRDEDGSVEMLLGAPGYGASDTVAGATYLIASSDLAAADAEDGTEDGVVDVSNAVGLPGSWKIVGENPGDRSGDTVSAPEIVADDDNAYVAIHSVSHRVEAVGFGAVYLLSADDLGTADAADGQSDSVIGLEHVASQPDSWKLISDFRSSWARWPVQTVGGDGATDDTEEIEWRLAVASYMASAADFTAADEADGHADGVIDLDRLAMQPNSLKVNLDHVTLIGDTDGDGGDDFAGHVFSQLDPGVHLISSRSLEDAEPATSSGERVLHLEALREAGPVRSMRAVEPQAVLGASPAGDIDGDGLADTLVGDPGPSTEAGEGAVYLLLSTDLDALDRADGATDNRSRLGNLAGDTDGDDVANTVDGDDDGDGIPDWLDAYQLDPAEWVDSDGDGTGDNADAFPNDRGESLDTDGDGLGDFRADDDDDGDGVADDLDPYPLDTDNDGSENSADADDDNDGVADIDDALPLDAAESEDADGDGTGDNADTDDDGDGVADAEDAFPLDPTESADSDSDGVGDHADAFPNDATESVDTDGDGTGDNADTDDDGDGVADADDDYPLDAGASMDGDGDSVPDSLDAFADDPQEWADTDGDGIGDNADTDDDGDGVADSEDRFPTDAARWDLTSIRFRLLPAHDSFVSGVAGVGDLDGDSGDDVAFRAPDAGEDTVLYIVDYDDFRLADEADGVFDGSVEVRNVPAQAGSWKLQGVDHSFTGVSTTALGDLDGDGKGEFLEPLGGYQSSGNIVSGADLLSIDALDGSANGVIQLGRAWSQPNSWRVRGWLRSGTVRAALPADFDGDDITDLAIGQPGAGEGESPGTVLLFSVESLSTLDALNGVDGFIQMNADAGDWSVVGELAEDGAGTALALADLDLDGNADLVVGAPGHDAAVQNAGAVYVLASRDRDTADLADGSEDSKIALGQIAAQPNSWKFVGDAASGNLGQAVLAGELTGDGRPDLVLLSQFASGQQPVISVISGDPEDIAILDAADGTEDRVIVLGSSGTGASATVTGAGVVPSTGSLDLADFDGDGRDDLVVGFRRYHVNSKVAHLLPASSFLGGYSVSGGNDNALDARLRAGGSYEIYAPEAITTDLSIVAGAAGDVDNDGKGDILVAVIPYVWGSAPGTPGPGSVYLLLAADLPLLDADDGAMDGRIFLTHVVGARR